MSRLPYDIRKAQAIRTAAVAREVARLGQLDGTWATIDDTTLDRDESRFFARVVTAQGLTFVIQGGTWGHETKVRGSLGDARLGAHRACPADEAAMVSAERGAETVLKELKRRVFCNPEAIASAQAALQQVQQLAQQATGLAEMVAQAEAMGLTFRDRKATDAHSAKGWHPAHSFNVFMTRDGGLTVDHLDLPLDKLPALLALLKA